MMLNGTDYKTDYKPRFLPPVIYDDKANKAMKYRKKLTVKPYCKFAHDTGEVAFPAAPCRGHKIICQHPENAGFVSYTKQCRKEKCMFFDSFPPLRNF